MKKCISVGMIIVLAISMLTGCGKSSGGKDGKVTIGIGQFAEHGSLDNCRKGFIEGLAQEGYKEGKNVKFEYENAQADGGTATQIATNFVANKVDLICAIATPMAQSAYGTAKDSNIPVIFTAVTNPVLAELAKKDKTPSGNVTGTSDKLPVDKQLQMIRTILPDAKKIGILYSTSEVNSISAIKEYKELASKYGFEIVESGISVTADIPLATDKLLNEVDCLTNLTDNTVVSSLPVILDKASDKNIPVFGSEIEQVKKGCLAAEGLDYYQLGIKTGKMAAQVLKGEKKASDMKYEVIEEAAFYGNTEVAKKLGITIPDELVGSAKEMFNKVTD
ncbi:ABC transporter substrate-binding protein [Anaeromicropila herbilytica]|uniref:ABC transporter substrate-binding protein n=1 Tax=Anaeromicropila herbilytica TaxID=2785025 RepID=A0A7R7EMW7_9FIRM|nr:ABC transporter substrate-binding protein [Anaeromicropila herbilytica]BCN31785.1 ABC transporter substrate-binding protein [Anaeromicropila herbilytica]